MISVAKIKSQFAALFDYLRMGKANRMATTAVEIAIEALPYIKIAGDIIVGITPTGIDDLAWNAIKAKYPALFNGSIHTVEELKILGLGVAATLLKEKFPKINTTTAVLATQIAFAQLHADNMVPGPPAPNIFGTILKSVAPKKSPLAL